MRGDALRTFRNNSSPSIKSLGDFLTVFRRKYVKPQSMATTKREFQQLLSNLAKQKVIVFLNILQKLAKGIWRCCPSDNRTNRIYQDASTPEGIPKPGALGEWHLWTDCVPSWKAVRAERSGNRRRIAEINCDATWNKTEPWKTQLHRKMLLGTQCSK